jgi:hypothetical protein
MNLKLPRVFRPGKLKCFWSTLTAIAQIQVFQVKYFEEDGFQLTVVCMNQSEQLPQVQIWSDFTPFAETILDQNEMLSHIKPHTHLFRREASNWDPAFQLYSGLVFTKNLGLKPRSLLQTLPERTSPRSLQWANFATGDYPP